MSEIINGKDALIALANGKTVEVKRIHDNEWKPAQLFGVSVFTDSETTSFRLKPRTITINGIEVPAPFEPKDGDKYYHISIQTSIGYGWYEWESSDYDARASIFGAWRTEEEIKQVVSALRSVFKGGV